MATVQAQQQFRKTPIKELFANTAERTKYFDFGVWFWGDGIAFDGMVYATELLDDPQYLDYMEKHFTRWVNGGTITWIDIVAPGHALIKLYEKKRKPEYLQMARKLADHLHNGVPRSYKPEAPIYQPDRPDFRNYVWVDSIYHVPSFFYYLANVTGDDHYREWGRYALRTHMETLQDKKTLLFPQGRDLSCEAVRGYGWGRGVGWAHLGLIDTWEMMPAGPERDRVKDDFVALSETILGYQDGTGCWRNLIHRQDSPLEASTAAFFAAAYEKGMRLGLLDDAYVAPTEKAWNYVYDHIDEQGGFFNVSACSWTSATMADDLDRYMRFYTEVNVWGQGAALRCIGERILSRKES